MSLCNFGSRVFPRFAAGACHGRSKDLTSPGLKCKHLWTLLSFSMNVALPAIVVRYCWAETGKTLREARRAFVGVC